MKKRMQDIEHLHVIGRCGLEDDCVSLFWTGSGVEFAVASSDLYLTLTANYNVHDLWLDIIIDGELIQRRMLDPGEQRICVFRGMTAATVKRVKLLRDTQAMPEDSVSRIDLKEVEFSGRFADFEPNKLQIEFIGDSITSGEGLMGHTALENWVPYCFSATKTYEYKVCRELGADPSVISQSGWGVYCSWEGNTGQAIPLYYKKLAGTLTSEDDAAHGSTADWLDYAEEHESTARVLGSATEHAGISGVRKHPDVIVVNLGTNDSFVADQPNLRENFEAHALAFLNQLRELHPEAYIFWAYGMLGDGLLPEIERAVAAFDRVDSVHRCKVIVLPDTKEEEFGARQHPGEAAHVKAAEVIVKEIRKLPGFINR